MLLQQNTKVALRQMAGVKPAVLEASQEQRKGLLSRLDSLQRSQKFFNEEYKGEDAAVHINKIADEVAKVSMAISELPEVLSIGQLCRQNPETVDDNIVLILNDLRLFFQVDNMISTDGLYSLCSIITAEYKSLSLEEIAICMNLAKLGHFGKEGKVYNRLDGATILGWLKQYVSEKQGRIDDRNYTAEVHNKIGKDEGRGAYMNNSTLLLEAQLAVMKEKTRKGKRKA